MATIVGIEIYEHVVRGVVVRTALRKAQVTRYLEVPIEEAGAPAPWIQTPLVAPSTGTLPGAAAPPLSVDVNPAAQIAAPSSDAFPGAPAPWAPVTPEAAVDAAVAEVTTSASEVTTSGEGERVSIAPDDPIAAAVRRLLKLAHVPGTATIACYPGRELSLRRIELPAAAAKKLEELLPYEVEAVVPFDSETSVLDHQPIETADGQLRVLVAVAPRERVRARLDVLAAAGLDPMELAAGAAALEGLTHLVPELQGGALQLLLDVHADRTDVCALRKGHVEFARTISVGADEVLAPRAGLGAQAFEGAAPREVSGPAAARLARELRQTLMSIRLATGAEPSAFWLCGEVEDPALAPWLSEILGAMPVPLPLPGEPVVAGVVPESESVERRARYALPLALAARTIGRTKRLDLRKGDLAPTQSMGAIRRFVPLAASCGAAVLCAFLFSSYAHWSVLDSRRAALEERLSTVTRERLGEETVSPVRARSLLESGSQRADPLPRFTALDALGAISASVPTEVEHDVSRLHIDLGDDRSGGRFEMQATVDSIEDHTQVVQALTQVPCFREVELTSSTQATDDRRSYRVSGEIQCPGDAPREETSSRSRRRGGGS